ncbi:Eukaryotic translation initiation factor 5A-1 [Desmophyllum pertusum]|uniref:Eukaryotic translation initiation factor 5 n=1 Tax=Desmophyllum pertusum TaxID=174260 RepID=A0A9W9YM82_9CNID|nr:Eukaryotic translation initiation factor 5A-1 [Desmophyllum pertusum]
MALVNVKPKEHRPVYRYKMPKLLAKVEGKGNGIKTVIVNMVEIAKALQDQLISNQVLCVANWVPQTRIDLKNERYIVNGSHDAEKLQEILDGFIEKDKKERRKRSRKGSKWRHKPTTIPCSQVKMELKTLTLLKKSLFQQQMKTGVWILVTQLLKQEWATLHQKKKRIEHRGKECQGDCCRSRKAGYKGTRQSWHLVNCCLTRIGSAKSPKFRVLFLRAFYESDLLEEEVILQWNEKVSKKEEDSSDEEEEEEVEVVYDTKAQQLKAHVDNTAANEEDDDLDIDAI